MTPKLPWLMGIRAGRAQAGGEQAVHSGRRAAALDVAKNRDAGFEALKASSS